MNYGAKSTRPSPEDLGAEQLTLATILAVLEHRGRLPATRLRDMRSAVNRVADLLGNEPAGIPLDMHAISIRLSAISPLAVGMSTKRFANIRSDFTAAVKASGVKPVTSEKSLSTQWVELLKRLSGRRAQIGLSRLARYASAHDIKPSDVNDDVIDGFIAAVREGSLHRQPKTLHRQVTLIWNEAAREPLLGLQPVTAPSFRGQVAFAGRVRARR
jgi:hypothetical protein